MEMFRAGDITVIEIFDGDHRLIGFAVMIDGVFHQGFGLDDIEEAIACAKKLSETLNPPPKF